MSLVISGLVWSVLSTFCAVFTALKGLPPGAKVVAAAGSPTFLHHTSRSSRISFIMGVSESGLFEAREYCLFGQRCVSCTYHPWHSCGYPGSICCQNEQTCPSASLITDTSVGYHTTRAFPVHVGTCTGFHDLEACNLTTERLGP